MCMNKSNARVQIAALILSGLVSNTLTYPETPSEFLIERAFAMADDLIAKEIKTSGVCPCNEK